MGLESITRPTTQWRGGPGEGCATPVCLSLLIYGVGLLTIFNRTENSGTVLVQRIRLVNLVSLGYIQAVRRLTVRTV